MKNEFMVNWDGLHTKDREGVLVLAATNRPFDLDEAVVRSLPRRPPSSLSVDLPLNCRLGLTDCSVLIGRCFDAPIGSHQTLDCFGCSNIADFLLGTAVGCNYHPTDYSVGGFGCIGRMLTLPPLEVPSFDQDTCPSHGHFAHMLGKLSLVLVFIVSLNYLQTLSSLL
ncbi:hypothetical protein LWI28_017119 [Acer negundo]|uniref:ATPase AAA-type core domain-containing protein n=1 Tax=Acer negundo TaxID=4023 RepID=A0AAD5IM49_ACENE|nr:hypothetical protein LWI28_017119 [Acer negundo]